MESAFFFDRGTPEDAAAVCDLIRSRIRWLDQNGLHGWNDHDYLHFYPKSYFALQAELGHLYVLRLPSGPLVSSVVLLDQDENWADFSASAAYYLHNLVSDPEHPGSGLQILREVERLARSQGKTCLRLDSQTDNAALTRFYEGEGYLPSARTLPRYPAGKDAINYKKELCRHLSVQLLFLSSISPCRS